MTVHTFTHADFGQVVKVIAGPTDPAIDALRRACATVELGTCPPPGCGGRGELIAFFPAARWRKLKPLLTADRR
jgi:hypothetical protein